jgi:membrane-associated protein
MNTLHPLIHNLLHLDTMLSNLASINSLWTYSILFLVIFCETGLIITPFLPGDSLLFAAGSLAAQTGQPLNILMLFVSLLMASFLGNQVNYSIGRLLGPKVFSSNRSWLFHKKHLFETRAFYERHGGKTIVFARFLPIIRTFAPFVAGVGQMNLMHFTAYNAISALLWIGSLLSLGYFLGSLPLIKEHFTVVIYGIIIVTLLPPLMTLLCRRMRG